MTLTPVAPEATADLKTSVIELPAQLLLAAAQFASSDPVKDSITKIQLALDEAGGVIRATNGHIAFRTRMPKQLLDGAYADFPAACGELQIPAASLRKPCAKAQIAVIGDGMVRFIDGKGVTCDLRPINWEPTVEFPKMDQLWPTEFHYDSGRPIGFSADYMITICQIVKRLSCNGVAAFSFNTPSTATALDASVTIGHGSEEYQLILEFLLMPVMLKDRRPDGQLEYFCERFNRRPADKRGGLTAKLTTGNWNSSYSVSFQAASDNKLVFTANTLSEAYSFSKYLCGA